MNYIKNILTVVAVLVLMAMPVSAQPELPNPGITPDSPFYFMDRMFDVFQSAESLADERASEMVAMAQTSNVKAMDKARAGYEKAMERRQRESEEDENVAEEVARQSTNHLTVLSEIRENVSQQAREGMDRAINESAKGRENALGALERKNPERANAVAEATLEEVMANAPEQALPGLQRALEAIKSRGRGESQSGEAGMPNGEGNVTRGDDARENVTRGNDTRENVTRGNDIGENVTSENDGESNVSENTTSENLSSQDIIDESSARESPEQKP